MDFGIMRQFLSAENIRRHLDHLSNMRNKLSIIEKSYPGINEMDIKAKREAEYLKKYILSHELFFNSFKSTSGICTKIKNHFISKERFIYDVIEIAKEKSYGFIYICIDKRKNPKIIYSSEEYSEPYMKYEPVLAFDLYEHVYFADYGFKREDFLKNAMIYLDLDALEAKLS